MPESRRNIPNIIITGTPGCGKSSHSQSLVDQLNRGFAKETTIRFKHFDVSAFAKEKDCLESYDKELDTHVVDEDKLLDELEPELEKGGAIVDWHCCEIFPERLIDLVVVLRTDNSKLHERLTKRNYKDNKIQENLDCEIMEVILTEARESYIPEIVIELRSDKAEDLDENVDRISAWVENWIKDHPRGVTNELQTVDGDASDSDDDEDNDNEDGELVTSGEDEGSYIPDNEEDSDDALASYHESEDPATVEDGLTNQQKYELEQKEQDDVEVLDEEDEETNEYTEHQEDVSE